jgi:hypothetical protein
MANCGAANRVSLTRRPLARRPRVVYVEQKGRIKRAGWRRHGIRRWTRRRDGLLWARGYDPEGPCDPEFPCPDFPCVFPAFAACFAAFAAAFACKWASELVRPGLSGFTFSSAA